MAFACKSATSGPEIQVSMGPRPHLWFFVFETAPLASELQDSIGPSPHLWFLHEKQRLVAQNYKSQGSQISPVVLCMQNNVISIRTTSLYGSQPSSVAFACKTASFGSELSVSNGPGLRLLICEWKTA